MASTRITPLSANSTLYTFFGHTYVIHLHSEKCLSKRSFTKPENELQDWHWLFHKWDSLGPICHIVISATLPFVTLPICHIATLLPFMTHEYLYTHSPEFSHSFHHRNFFTCKRSKLCVTIWNLLTKYKHITGTLGEVF